MKDSYIGAGCFYYCGLTIIYITQRTVRSELSTLQTITTVFSVIILMVNGMIYKL
ncbi:MAG: hypothetical protein GDA51_08430 [Ekhidna sp.]|nr:hypothetical protein [Ekhidna sp.]